MAIEKEVKYEIKNDAVSNFFFKSHEIGPYFISLGHWVEFHDIYMDTPDFQLFMAGYYLRCRKEKGVCEYVWTLKKTGGFSGEVHRRKEYLGKTESPEIESLKGTEIESIIEKITNENIVPVLEMTQKRYFRDLINEGRRRKAVLSVDFINFNEFSFSEIEIESISENEDDLEELMKVIDGNSVLKSGLKIESRSKFEKCLEKMMIKSDDGEDEKEKSDQFLSLKELITLKNISKNYTNYNSIVKQADVLLLLNLGKTLENISSKYNLSIDCINDIKSDFFKNGLKTFPINTSYDDCDFDKLEILHTYSRDQYQGIKSTFEEIIKKFEVLAHHKLDIIKNYSMLYESLSLIFAISGNDNESLFKKAYEISNIEQRFSSKYNLQFTKEIAGIYAPEELTREEILKIEIMFDIIDLVGLRRLNNSNSKNSKKLKRLKKYKEKSKRKKQKYVYRSIRKIFEEKCADIYLTPKSQVEIIGVAALFEIADYFKEKLYDIEKIEVKEDSVKILYFINEYEKIDEDIYGKTDYKSSSLSETLKSPLLNEVLGIPINIKPIGVKKENDKEKGSENFKLSNSEKIYPDDYIETAAAKILLNQVKQVIKNYDEAAKGESPDAVHNMRVAIRKIRGVFTVFHDYLDESWVLKYSDGFKDTLSSMGAVRDLDVLKENLMIYTEEKDLETLSPDVLKLLQSEKEEELVKMREVLLGTESKELIANFKKDLETGKYIGRCVRNKKGDVFATRTKDVIPVIIFERASNITAYREWVHGKEVPLNTFHRLRIECKNMRYSLEFFSDLLGPAGKEMKNVFKEFQSVLGDIQDISAGDLIIENIRNKSDSKEANDFSKTIQEDKKSDIPELMDKFFEKWKVIDENYMSEKIYEMIKYMNAL